MITYNKLKGFLKGFFSAALVVLIMVAIGLPTVTSAQSGSDNPIPNRQVTESPSLQRTDDPLGRVQIPIAHEEHRQSNLELMQSENALANTADTLTPPEDAAALEAEMAAMAAQGYESPLVIPSADFRADGSQPDSLYFSFGGGYMTGSSAAYGCVMAPVYLPDNVSVTYLYASVYDNDATYGIAVSLRRVDNYAGGTDLLASAGTTGEDASTSIQTVYDSSIDNPIVSYPDYSYYLTTCLLSSSLRLYSVRIYYAQ